MSVKIDFDNYITYLTFTVLIIYTYLTSYLLILHTQLGIHFIRNYNEEYQSVFKIYSLH